LPSTELAAEDRLVLLLARGRRGPEVEAEARTLLATALRWDLILMRAEEHEVYPLLHYHLRDLGFVGVPAAIRQALEALQRVNALRVTLLAEELARILSTLADRGIPAIPLKGPALAESLYEDLTLRTAGDLDVLVPRQLAPRAMESLARIGYHAEITAPFLERLVLHARVECSLAKPGPPLDSHLDLHWGILLLPRWERDAMRDLWAHSAPSTCVGGVPCQALSPEWELLYLCAHAASHRWQGLKWLADIHEVCVRRPLDWSRLEATARRLGWQDLVGISLSLCASLFGTPVPRGLVSRAIPGWLVPFPAADPNPGRDVRGPLLPGAMARACHLAASVFVPTAGEAWALPLPGPLAALYYPLRPLRLAWRWGTWVTRRAAARVSGRT
jgi:hypothetical protein